MGRLREAGHLARILTTGHRVPDHTRDASEDPDVHRELQWYWRDHEWRSLSPLARLRLERHNAKVFDRHLEEFRPDVITWWPLGGLSLSLVERARRLGIPALFFVLDPWPAYGPRHDLWLRMWRRVRLGRRVTERVTGLPTRVDLVHAGRWLFCSETMRAQTLATLPDIDAGGVISPGVEASFTSAPPEPEPPPWRWKLLYIGRVVEQKGVRTAIECLPLLPQGATLRVVGDGDRAYRSELERLASRLNVRERVRFQPSRPRKELVDVFRSADAVVFPVLWSEPFGLVPLEAMALRCLVVATGRGGSGDYLEHGGNSLLFEPGSASALAAALNRLAGDPALRTQLRRGGQLTATTHTETAFNDRVLAEIEAAAGPPGSAQRTA